MLHLLKGRVAWRVAAVLMLVMAMALMPAVAYAGDHGKECRVWHKVYAGENLSQIAARYGVSWWYLADYNGLSNPRVIIPGQRICIPPKGGHHGGGDDDDDNGWHGGGDHGKCWVKVRAGDNLSRIGARVGVPWPKLAKINDLESPWIVIPGQKIRICY